MMTGIFKPADSGRGYILLAASLLLTAFMSVVLVCSFVAGHGSDNDFRYVKTRLCIKKVRQAVISNGGGFISDYGEPDNMTPFSEMYRIWMIWCIVRKVRRKSPRPG